MDLDIMASFEKKRQAIDFIWKGFLTKTVGGLIAPGGTGKSFWALEAAMAVATQNPQGDLLTLKPERFGRVIYYAAEDSDRVLDERIYVMGEHFSSEVKKSIAENLTVSALLGTRLNIMRESDREKIVTKSIGARLIVLDTLSRFHTLDENNNMDMSQLISTLECMAYKTGASVLFLHHVNKTSARDGQTDQQYAARGASALVDNIRWCGFVAKMTEEEAKRLSDQPIWRSPICKDRRDFFIRFGVSKQNNGNPMVNQWYKRQDGGVLLPVKLHESKIDKLNTKRDNRDYIS